MSRTNINISMETETNQAFARFCEGVGLSVGAAFNIFAQTVVKEQKFPFEFSDEIPNEETKAAMNEYYDMLEHPEKYKHYSSFREILQEVEDET